MRLSRTMLFVKDLPRMAAFYGDTLGLTPLAGTRTDSWAEFDSGLALHAIPPHIAAEIEITQPPAAREMSPVKLIFAVPDTRAEWARLERLGIPLLRRPWGGCDGLDPEGNVFGLVDHD